MTYLSDGETLELANGESVTQVRFDYAVTLVSDSWVLRLNAEFTLQPVASSVIVVDPEHLERNESVMRLLDTLNRPVRRIFYTLAGDMMIDIDGTRILASPHPKYESWEISGHSGALIVCAPGGGVTEFG